MSPNLIFSCTHYDDVIMSPIASQVIMSPIASQIASLAIVYASVWSGVNQRKHQSSASLAFVRGIHHWPVNSPHKWPVTRKMFPFDDVTMCYNDVPWVSWHLKSSTTCLTACSSFKENIKAQHDWLFVRRFHQWPVNFPYPESEMSKAFPCHAAIGVGLELFCTNSSLDRWIFIHMAENYYRCL